MKIKSLFSAAFFLSCFLLLDCQSDAGEEESAKPNILFILADDLGAMDLSSTGSSFYETPNIDRIAEEGTRFTQAYAASRVCSPSRASIFTGQFTARHGITDWIGAKTDTAWRSLNRHDKLLPARYQSQLSATDSTLAEALRANGYQTFFAGKWHLGGSGSHPEDHGFDRNIGGWDKGSPIGGFFAPWENPNLPNRKAGENLSMRLGTETANFIREEHTAPFFAFLSFYAVHAPLQCRQSQWAKYQAKAKANGWPESGFKMERVLPIRQTQDHPIYAGLLESMDDAIGLVLDALQEAGVAENTIIVFTSDNGGVASGDAFATSNLPLRGGKGYQWEGGIREPCFIKIPQLQDAVKQLDYPICGSDFFPTLLSLSQCNLIPEQHIDGIDFSPLFAGETLPERALYWHYPHYGNQGGEPSSIIRKGDWKLIHYWEDERDELYLLKEDVSEQNDLADQYPEQTKRMRHQLLEWLEECRALRPTPDPAYDETLARQHRQEHIEKLWPKLEADRLKFLSDDFEGPDNWWGSKNVMD